MLASNGYAQYQQQGVMTARPSDLVVMLYDGAIKNLKLGVMGITSKDYSLANTSLGKAKDIVMELVASLNFEYEISDQLLSLYDYFRYEITQANTEKDASHIEPVIEMMSDLRNAFAEVAKTARSNSMLVDEM